MPQCQTINRQFRKEVQIHLMTRILHERKEQSIGLHQQHTILSCDNTPAFFGCHHDRIFTVFARDPPQSLSYYTLLATRLSNNRDNLPEAYTGTLSTNSQTKADPTNRLDSFISINSTGTDGNAYQAFQRIDYPVSSIVAHKWQP